MDMNDDKLQMKVITYDVLCIGQTFFFHDEFCVNLRKYKEIIRKYVSESELPLHKRSENVPDYVRNLLSNFNNLIGVSGTSSIPKPTNPREEKQVNKSFTKMLSSQSSTHVKSLTRKLSKATSKESDQNKDREREEEQIVLMDEDELKMVQQQRHIACILLNREKNVCDKLCNGFIFFLHLFHLFIVHLFYIHIKYNHKYLSNQVLGDEDEEWEFDDIPREIQYCDTSVYGESLWEFVMQQLLTKQIKSLWLLLAYFSMEIPTIKAIELLQTHIADIAKVKDMDNLELVCSAVIENSHYPIATALHLSNFVSAVAEDDLSRKQEFQEIADRYTVVAEKLVESVESDHLLSIYLETPTDLNMMSVFEIAIAYEMSDFFDNNRVDRIMGHMWSQFDFLNPALNFRTRDIDLYEMLKFLCYHPAQFYFSPVGRYYIQSLMYIAYVALITVVSEQQAYLYESLSLLEVIMWICNAGYALFEVMEMSFRGIEYFSDSTNYFDMG